MPPLSDSEGVVMDIPGRDRIFRAKQHNLPIRIHLQKMYSKYLREVVQYPKTYKPTIGQDMRECFVKTIVEVTTCTPN